MKNIMLSALMLLALTGCKREETAEGKMAAVTEVDAANAPVTEDKTVVENAATAYPSQKIIRNANLRFETADMDATAAKIAALVKKYHAQVQNDSQNKDDYARSRTMVVRLPSQMFDGFITDLGKGVSYFERKEISSEDVTEAYVDTEARIKAKKVLEARYLELIGKAKKVSEVLEIEKELSAIREEIEAKEGQLRYMKDRIALSTINIEFFKKDEVAGGTTVSYGSKMGTAIKSGFNGLSSFFLGLLYIWPFILIFVIAFIIFRKKFRKKKQL